MTLDSDRSLVLAAQAALELDKLDRVIELASKISGSMRANGLRDYFLGSVLARRGEHEQALQIALSLYGAEISRGIGERLRNETLALMQGRGTAPSQTSWLDEALLAAPVGINPLEPLTHVCAPSPLGPEANWQGLFAFWCERIGQGKASELGRYGQAQLDRLVNVSGAQALGLRVAQDSMGYDEANAFAFVYYLLAMRGVESLPPPVGVVFPDDDREVEFSIILPVFNKWILSLNCLRSLSIARHGCRNFEVILADDASTDATGEIVEANSWMRSIRLEKNSGFVENCNNAAAHARGNVLLFLNNDTLVGNGWLGALLGSLQRRPGVGVVGSQVYGSDGGLLESGGILWGNGDVWNHGRGFGPERWFELDHEREVDYVSGCAMAIRRELWQRLAGFDLRYRPAYCEDADFCLRAREAGMAVLVQPQSRILHLEGLSNARTTEAGLKRHQLTNLVQLRQRWNRLLLTEQPIDMSRQLMASDRGLRRGPVVLVVDHYFPTPDRDAGSRCTLSLVSSFLALGFKIIFLPDNFAPMEAYRRRLEEWGVLCLWGDSISQGWPEWLSKQVQRVDLILYNRPHITMRFLDSLSRIYPKAYRVYNTHDLHGWREFLKNQQPSELPDCLDSPPDLPSSLRELCTDQECHILSKMQAIISISEKESRKLCKYFPRKVYTVPGYIVRWRGGNAGRECAFEAVLFVGGFGHHPNLLGLEWFLHHVWPRLADRARLLVVGSNCPEQLEQRLMETAGVQFEGSVSDQRLAELYAMTRISVAPLPYGAGLKGKVVEALSWGHRVVGSAYAFEGLDQEPWCAPASGMCCCHTPDEFVLALQDGLAMDLEEACKLDSECEDFIERCFSSAAQQRALQALLPPQFIAQGCQGPLPSDLLPWPEVIRSGDPRAINLLASTNGLCHDGWLESSNRLVLELQPGLRELLLGFYLPETGIIDGQRTLEIELGNGQDSLLRGRLAIQPGQNRTLLKLPQGITTLATIVVRSFFSYQPKGLGDQRQLVVVLSELQAR